jgi:bidirectional [NiFe] hydrogenase diaphorase subunit
MDGVVVTAREGATILDAAREHDVAIPTLCQLDGLSNVGACRLCLVEVADSPKLLPACTTKVRDDMVVVTTSPRLERYRRMIAEMFFSERNHVCAVCVSNGRCELQQTAYRVGMTHVRLDYLHPNLPVDASHARFAIDHNRCILCTRCVRACDEIEGAHTWDVAGRGVDARVVVDMNQPWGESTTCTSCGKCVQSCPTGALFDKQATVGAMAKRPETPAQLLHARSRPHGG